MTLAIDSENSAAHYGLGQAYSDPAWFAGTRDIYRSSRTTPRSHLSAPITSFVVYLRGGGAVDLHGASNML